MSGGVGQARMNRIGGLPTGVAINMLNSNMSTDMYSNYKIEVMNNNIVKISEVSYMEPNALFLVLGFTQIQTYQICQLLHM